MRTAIAKLPRALAALPVAAALALLALPAPAGAAQSWWQVLSGSRPSNLQVAPDQTEIQEVKATRANLSILGQILVARLEVGGEPIGCLGSGAFAEGLCEVNTEGLFTATETAQGLEEILEGPYGAGEVEVSGGPAGTAPFLITTPGRWVAPLEVTRGTFSPEEGVVVQLGSASAEVKSQGSGRLVTTVTNLGNAPVDATSTPLEILDELPEGASAYGVEAEAGGQGLAGPVDCTIEAPELLSCSFEDELAPYEAIVVEVLVALAPGAGEGEAGEVSVSGGDGPPDSAPQALNLSDEEVPFGLEHFSMRAEEEGGKETTGAGSHPFQLTTTVVAKAGAQSQRKNGKAHVEQPALPRNLRFTLPAGLAGDATAVPTCDLATFLQQTEQLVNECPDESAIGVSSATIIDPLIMGLTSIAVPVFNLPPARGEPARFGLMTAGVPVVIDTSVDPSDGYRITAEVRNIPQTAQFLSATTTIWGDPGSPAHDGSRGWNCAYFGAEAIPGECSPPVTRDESPFLRMPAHCQERLAYEAAFEPWNAPLGSVLVHASDESQAPLTGCNGVPFDPSISSTFTSRLTATPSGQDFELNQPRAGFGKSPRDTPEAQAKRIEVILPEGVTLNPSAGEGLATCSPQDYARERYDSAPDEGCPDAAKVGTLEAETPLIAEKLEGDLYVAEPYENPFGSLIAAYAIVRSPERGILVKQPLEGNPDERTGQLRFTATDAPPLPYTNLRLHLRAGGRAPLATPPTCGTYETLAKFLPYSAADLEDPDPSEIVERESPFEIDRGTDGGACPTGGLPPFNPGLLAGTINNRAGSFSPFNVRLTRKDGEQEITHFSIKLPPGVTGMLAGVPYCPDAAIAAAKARTGPHGGAEELDSPSCPAASEVGRTLAGAGVGQVLAYAPGKLYLAGPYHGSKLSIVAITAGVVGPFDIGTVVIRQALQVNPETAEVFIDATGSDPIPHIIRGIPVHLRDIRAYVGEPDFVLNPTDCTRTSTASTVLGSGLDFVSEADDNPITVTSPFQAADCAALPFKPKLTMRLRGGTHRGAHPAFSAHLQMNGIGEAAIAFAQVTLPRSEFIENAHFDTICTRVQFKAGAGNGAECPAGSIYGKAKAVTPLLSEPVEGPVFLRSSEHQLPDLVVALHNSQVDFNLVGRVDSVKGGGLRNTFEAVPDAPVASFDIALAGGKKGLFVNSTDLCAKKHRAKADFDGQNGKAFSSRPVLRVKCRGKGRGKGQRRQGKHGGNR